MGGDLPGGVRGAHGKERAVEGLGVAGTQGHEGLSAALG